MRRVIDARLTSIRLNIVVDLNPKHILAPLLERTGHANEIRDMYHGLVQPFKICTLEIADHSAKFWVPSRTHEMPIRYFTEQKQLELFLRLILPGDIVWDVGANMGIYSIFSAKIVHQKRKIYAFEPEAKIRKILNVNRLINHLSKEVTVAIGLREIYWNYYAIPVFYRYGNTLRFAQIRRISF